MQTPKVDETCSQHAHDRGRIVLDSSMDDFEARYLELSTRPEHLTDARGYKPIHERQLLGRSILLFDGVDRERLTSLGEVRTPSLADLFVAMMANGGASA